MHEVADSSISTGLRHPRGNPAWPKVGIFAQRASSRPNRIGSTICRVERVEGTRLYVCDLDAMVGTPVLDIKPVMREFLPRQEIRQPDWTHELMRDYFLPTLPVRLVPIEKTPGKRILELCAERETVNEVVQAALAMYQQHGYQSPWLAYLAYREQRCVGTCQFAGPPVEGDVEIAFHTFPGNEAKGVARSMVQELLRMTGTHARGIRYIALTLPEESASTAVLRKLGFTLLDEIEHPDEGKRWKWCKVHGSNGRIA